MRCPALADGFPWARRLERRDEVEQVVWESIEFKGLAFPEVIMDPDACVYPIVLPGQAYD